MSNVLDALKAARQFIVNGTALGFIRMPDADTPDSAHDTLPMIERAIAGLDAPAKCDKCYGAGKIQIHTVCGATHKTCECSKPVAQPQGEPVARLGVHHVLSAIHNVPGFPGVKGNNILDLTALLNDVLASAKQPAPVAMVPDGYCIMPRQLTAENGAKALLLGEFKLLVTKECPECCELEEPTEGCSICDGEGEYGQKHTIPWDQIKFIYSKAVSGLSIKQPGPAITQEPEGA